MATDIITAILTDTVIATLTGMTMEAVKASRACKVSSMFSHLVLQEPRMFGSVSTSSSKRRAWKSLFK